MNDQTQFRLIVAGIAAFLVSAVSYFSYIGFGLPTEKDPVSLRQDSATNQRSILGGSRAFGK